MDPVTSEQSNFQKATMKTNSSSSQFKRASDHVGPFKESLPHPPPNKIKARTSSQSDARTAEKFRVGSSQTKAQKRKTAKHFGSQFALSTLDSSSTVGFLSSVQHESTDISLKSSNVQSTVRQSYLHMPSCLTLLDSKELLASGCSLLERLEPPGNKPTKMKCIGRGIIIKRP